MTARKSFVRLISEWPRRSKELGWGFRVDEIWFEVPQSEVVDEMRRARRYWSWDVGLLTQLVERRGVGELTEFHWVWPGGRERRYERFPDGVWRRLYMRRRMLYLGGLSLPRIHTFFSGDDPAAPHDHPFWFWTFPLRSYTEEVEEKDEISRGPRAGRMYS